MIKERLARSPGHFFGFDGGVHGDGGCVWCWLQGTWVVRDRFSDGEELRMKEKEDKGVWWQILDKSKGKLKWYF